MRSSRAQAGKDDEVVTRVLGVDPGTVVTGWGVVEARGDHMRHVASGVVRPRGARTERLAAIYEALSHVCERLVPTVLSLEQTFVGDNIQTAFRLGEARGAVMVAAAGMGLPVVEYSPAEIKVAVAGSGRAAKGQMQAMVERLLRLETPLVADEADALGAAICHVHASRFKSLVAQHSSIGGQEGSAGGHARRATRRR